MGLLLLLDFVVRWVWGFGSDFEFEILWGWMNCYWYFESWWIGIFLVFEKKKIEMKGFWVLGMVVLIICLFGVVLRFLWWSLLLLDLVFRWVWGFESDFEFENWNIMGMDELLLIFWNSMSRVFFSFWRKIEMKGFWVWLFW